MRKPCRPALGRADRMPRRLRRGQFAGLAIQAMRVRCTVGEVSDALESVWGRHRADTHKVSGVYAGAYTAPDEWTKLQPPRWRVSRPTTMVGARA